MPSARGSILMLSFAKRAAERSQNAASRGRKPGRTIMQKVTERVAQTRTLGDVEVTAVYDGPHAIPFDFVLGVDGAECRRLEGETGDMVTLSVNCFLIKHQGKTILVDAGGGTTMATLGLLPGNLRALGVAPDAIDHILL